MTGLAGRNSVDQRDLKDMDMDFECSKCHLREEQRRTTRGEERWSKEQFPRYPIHPTSPFEQNQEPSLSQHVFCQRDNGDVAV